MAATLAAGDRVVDFALTGTDGRVYDSAKARREGPLLFTFYKKGCGTCQFTLPFLQRFHETYNVPGFQIWGIAQDSADDTKAVIEHHGLTFPLLVDGDLSVTEQYHLVSVPDLYLTDESGVILHHAPAFVSDEINAMARVVAERTGRPYAPIVKPEDNAPAIKPG